MTLPENPAMLLSFVNMKLRDNYSSLEALCDDLDINQKDLIQKLNEAGFVYSADANKFW